MMNILLIEEDRETRKYIKKSIEASHSDFKVTKEVQNLTQALEAIKDDQIHLVLISNKIQKYSGLQIFDKINKSKPEIKTVIYNAELSEYENMQSAIGLGLMDYLFKPLRIQDLSRCLNSVSHIMKVLAKKDENKKRILLSYYKTLPIFEDRFLIDLVHGHIESDEEAQRLFKYFNMRLEPDYTVIVAKIDYFDKLSLAFDEEDKHIFVFTVCDIIKSVFFNLDATIFINRYDEITIIVGNQLNKEECIELSEKICREVEKETITTVTLGIGRKQSKPTQIEVSYKQAKAAIRHSYYYGVGETIHIDYVEKENDITYNYPMKKEQLLIYQVIVGNKKRVMELLDDIFSSLKRVNNIPEKLIPKVLLNIIISISKHANEQNIDMQDFFVKHISVKEIMGKEKIDDAYEYMVNILELMCIYVEEIRTEKDSETLNMVSEFIKANYYKDINTYSVSKELNISTSYINKLFTNAMMMKLADYIDRIRMEKAKELLVESKDDFGEIAKKVGYNDETYFLKLFKYITGVSAAEFKDKDIQNIKMRANSMYKV